MGAGKRSRGSAILTLVAAWLVGGIVPTGVSQAQLPPSATELHRAAHRGDVAAVQALLAAGANVNAQDYFNQTPLHYAAAAGHKDVAELLLAGGAGVDVVDWWGETPLYYAVDGGYKDVVELLLTRGASVHIKDTRGRTPLHAAISYDNDEIWIPEQIDFRGLESSLKKYVATARSDPTYEGEVPVSLLTDFHGYARQYSGFVRGGVRYIVCCLHSFSQGSSFVAVGAGEERFPLVFDGGCGIVIVVFEADSKAVVHTHCHGRA